MRRGLRLRPVDEHHVNRRCGNGAKGRSGRCEERPSVLLAALPLSAGSTLAKSLVGHPVLWPWLGISQLDASNVKPWMLAHLDRLHIFVPAESSEVLPVLEMYVRARVGSVFEGSA